MVQWSEASKQHTSAIPRARKLAPRIRSWAAGLLGSASRMARKTKDEMRPKRK